MSRVLIAGDVWPNAIEGRSLAARLELTQPLDLFVFTLDGAVASGPRRGGYAWMPFDPAHLSDLAIAKTNLAVIASNHITDFGDGGVRATLAALEANGFRHVGAGATLEQARRPALVDLPAGRVAIIAFADTEPRVSAIAASENSAGVQPLELEACLAAIRAAREQADWVWVMLHWGEEFVRYPEPQQRRMARQMIDAGASLVVASHMHVPLGFERRGSGTIFYGMGNFLFPPYRDPAGYWYRWTPATRQAVVAAGEFRDGQWHWEPRAVSLCREGLPKLARHGSCPDYGQTLPADLDEYAQMFPKLRRKERVHFYLERLRTMSWGERKHRALRLLNRTQAKSNGSL